MEVTQLTPEPTCQRTVWYSEALEESTTSSWAPLRAEHAIRVSDTGAYSVLVRGDQCDLSQEQEDESLVSRVWSSVKSGVAHFMSSVYYNVHCEALLQEGAAEGMSVGIVVVLYLSEGGEGARRHPRPRPAGTTLVGRTLTPRAVKAGHLQVRLISKDIVADTEQGEDASLCKTESDFCGRDFEKQFACRYKLGPVKEGIFGKVVVEHVKDTGEVSPVLEFNLTRGGVNVPVTAAVQPIQHTPSSPVKRTHPSDLAKRPIQELADTLRITEAQNWRFLADHLGFTSREVSRFASSPDQFNRVVSSYQSRGGTQDEVVQALYDVSREFSFSPVKRQRTSTPESFKRRCVRPQSSISSQTTICLGESEDEDEDVSTSSLSRSDTLELTPKGIFPLTSSAFTVTPPTTPRKRNSSSCSESDLSLQRSPVKRMRSMFSFDDPEDLSRRMCTEALTESVLSQVSLHIQREWKHIGRTLRVPENELYSIEHVHKDLRECAYQTLLRWRDMFPRKFTYGTLYTALCENGLSGHAQKFCVL